ncbi:MAG TPA: DNA mismatch repair protein MutS, partial [Firmicutes bacterium]|nr:DNA mismatch repair protein MutS [Bacillota bacterium]
MAQEQKLTAPTPLMAQYAEIKARHSDSILFFRLGDFYEMFGEDAKTASAALEVALTKRQGVPMCGVPYHAANTYISKLLKKGFKVSICEQKGDEASSKNNKLFKREVVRIITPGTILEENILKPKNNNFLAAVNLESKENRITGIGIAFADISTGRFETTEIGGQFEEILDSELSKYEPSEIILSNALKNGPHLLQLAKNRDIPVSFTEDWDFNPFEGEN